MAPSFITSEGQFRLEGSVANLDRRRLLRIGVSEMKISLTTWLSVCFEEARGHLKAAPNEETMSHVQRADR